MVARLLQGMVVKHYRLMVDIQAAGENGFRILLLRAVPCQHVIFAAGGQLIFGAVHGIYFGSQLNVHYPEPQS